MEDPTLPPPPAATESSTPTPLPWEDGSAGPVIGLWETVKLFALQPQEAFNRLSPIGIGRPFFYAVIMAWIQTIVGFAYFFVFQLPFFFAGLPELDEELAGMALGAGMATLLLVGLLILMPLFVAIALFIHTCILHLMLLIIGEGKGGFEATFRLLCYAHTADLANIVPFCGGLLSLVWFVVLQVIGLAETHRCSYAKAALAVFLPILLCCACVAVLLTMGVGAGILGALADR
jgi:hypothetical protein